MVIWLRQLSNVGTRKGLPGSTPAQHNPSFLKRLSQPLHTSSTHLLRWACEQPHPPLLPSIQPKAHLARPTLQPQFPSQFPEPAEASPKPTGSPPAPGVCKHDSQNSGHPAFSSVRSCLEPQPCLQ